MKSFPDAMTLLVAALITVGPASRADDIRLDGAALERIKIVSLDGSRIGYRTPAGELHFVPISDVRLIAVDSVGTLRDFNEAEDAAANGRHDRALVRYERALRLAEDFWTPLVRARLLQSCDRGGDFDAYTRHFLAMVADDAHGPPLAAELLPPVGPPPGGAAGYDRALRAIAPMVDRSQSQSARVLVEMLRFVIAVRAGSDDVDRFAAELVKQPVPPAVATRPVYRIRAAAISRWIETGQRDAGMATLNYDLASAPEYVLPELLLVKARTLLHAAQKNHDAIRAGWDAMRIVIHYPDDPLVPDALLLAAAVHERIDRLPTARLLLDECLNHDKASQAVRQRAEQDLARLRSNE